jgi:cytochrome c-type biogenesis protein CcmH/NrfG
MLDAHNWRRATELCRAWVDLDYGNSEAWRCVGQALQHEGQHQEAVNALRKAKQFDPDDRTLDTAIARSQHAIVAQFLSTAR